MQLELGHWCRPISGLGAVGAQALVQVKLRARSRWGTGPLAGQAQAQMQLELRPRCSWSSGPSASEAQARVQVKLRQLLLLLLLLLLFIVVVIAGCWWWWLLSVVVVVVVLQVLQSIQVQKCCNPQKLKCCNPTPKGPPSVDRSVHFWNEIQKTGTHILVLAKKVRELEGGIGFELLNVKAMWNLEFVKFSLPVSIYFQSSSMGVHWSILLPRDVLCAHGEPQ